MDKQIYIDKIGQALDLVRPFLNADGGDISFVELTDDMVVKVQLLGACRLCSMNLQTLKSGIEHTIRRVVPEVRDVVSIDEDSEVIA